MKLIGKNSASTYLRYLFFLLFTLISCITIYELFGFGITFYNLKADQNLFEETFYVGNSIDWGGKLVNSETLFFRFKFPFSNHQLVTGTYTLGSFIYLLLGGIFWSLLFFFSYKIFNEISSEKVFTKNIISWLRRFAYINFIFTVLFILNWQINFKYGFSGTLLFTSLTFSFIGVLVFFVTEFFKKGYELQSENDLTI